MPASATLVQLRAAFLALSPQWQEAAVKACASLLPAKLRQRIQRYLAAHPSGA